VEFNRDIRPILSDCCYTCHRPDQANRKSKLRLDQEDSAKADLGGRFGIAPGDPAKKVKSSGESRLKTIAACRPHGRERRGRAIAKSIG
jgi:hypothetical protein